MASLTERLDYRTLPVILLGATWATLDVALKAWDLLTKRKDQILALSHESVKSPSGPRPATTIQQLNNFLWSDYVLLSLASAGFCFVFAVLVWKIPTFYRTHAESQNDLSDLQKVTLKRLQKSMQKACRFVALFGIFGAIGFVIGCVAGHTLHVDRNPARRYDLFATEARTPLSPLSARPSSVPDRTQYR